MPQLVRLRPGADREQVLANLRNARNQVDAASAHRGADLFQQYQRWAHSAARQLANQISTEDIDRLVLTRRYWLLQAAPIDPITEPLVHVELAERRDDLDDAIAALDSQIRRWSEREVFAVADTTFYVQPADTFDKVNYAALLGSGFAPVRLLIPIIVVDELDGLKRANDGRVRGRARQALAIIDRLFAMNTETPQQLREEDGDGGEVTVELVFDPPGHVRLPIADDEIVDRAAAIQALAGRALSGQRLRFITFDTRQSLRARHAGLKAEKQRDPERAPRPSGGG